MKKILLLAILALGVLGAWAFYPKPPGTSPVAEAPSQTDAAKPDSIPAPLTVTKPAKPAALPVPAPLVVKKEPEPADEFIALGKTILSAQATFDEKNSAWEQLRNSGQLDHAIAELEKLAAAEPDAPETFVALGRAYMYKSGTVQDITQVGLLGMKIDESFNAALKLDPANWDAQYFKAVALSYYPAFMNKGPEVVKAYASLIQQQEKTPAQPQFANAYLRLGEQFQKQGDSAHAQQAWQRGAELFPANEDLRKKVNPPATPAAN